MAKNALTRIHAGDLEAFLDWKVQQAKAEKAKGSKGKGKKAKKAEPKPVYMSRSTMRRLKEAGVIEYGLTRKQAVKAARKAGIDATLPTGTVRKAVKANTLKKQGKKA